MHFSSERERRQFELVWQVHCPEMPIQIYYFYRPLNRFACAHFGENDLLDMEIWFEDLNIYTEEDGLNISSLVLFYSGGTGAMHFQVRHDHVQVSLREELQVDDDSPQRVSIYLGEHGAERCVMRADDVPQDTHPLVLEHVGQQ